jgi:hypothetical protein
MLNPSVTAEGLLLLKHVEQSLAYENKAIFPFFNQ